MVWKSNGEDAYFVACNSKNGFFSYYKECFEDSRIRRLFAIKGGPGTGKSRFMRDVAEYGAAQGCEVEHIYCSSDPDSLDGVILDRGDGFCVALLDATAPHVYEPSRVGVRDEMVNLGAFWDHAALARQEREIEALNAAKRAAYQRAYHHLAALGEMLAVRDGLLRPFVRIDAIEAYAAKLLREISTGRGHTVRHTLMRSLGMCGEVGLFGLQDRVKRFILIDDCHGVAGYLTAAALKIAEQRRQPVRISHDPIDPDVIDAIFFEDLGILLTTRDLGGLISPDKRVGVRRFLEATKTANLRVAVSGAARVRRQLFQEAFAAFRAVREAHFGLEAIYSATMDFSAKENFTKSFCKELFDLQTR